MTTIDLPIEAQTVTLLGSPSLLQDSKGDLLKFLIPIYQRPYSWEREQIRRFLQTVIQSYRDGGIAFLGTLLLMKSDEKKIESPWEVVDGQQRLTTVLLLTKLFELMGWSELVPMELQHRGWLKSGINLGKEEEAMQETLALQELPVGLHGDSHNRYSYRLQLIQEEFCDLWDDVLEEQGYANRDVFKRIEEFKGKIEQDPKTNLQALKGFFEHLTHHVCMVRIISHTGLAKALDIFDTINTTGMALSGADIFKVRMYDYLTTHGKRGGEEAFSLIDNFYGLVEQGNKQNPHRITDVEDILGLYQHVFIERFGLSRETHRFAAGTFWDRLMRSILSEEHLEHFHADKYSVQDAVSMDHLMDLANMRFLWEKPEVRTLRNLNWCRMIFLSRYGGYWWMVVLYLHRYYPKDAPDSFDVFAFERFNELLTKFYITQSLLWGKVTNPNHRFTHEVIHLMLHKPSPVVEQQLRKKLSEVNQWELLGRIADPGLALNYRNAKLVCMMDLMAQKELVEEDNAEVFRKIFDEDQWNWDIEHIQSRNGYEQMEGESPLKVAWGPLLNSLGNLTFLNRSDNRSQSDLPYPEKRSNFTNSAIVTAKMVGDAHEHWTPESCAKRKEEEVKKIMKFIFGEMLDPNLFAEPTQ
jgi:hypothetical protein